MAKSAQIFIKIYMTFCFSKIWFYKRYLSSEIDVLLYFSLFHNILNSMTFISGGVQKHLDSKNLLPYYASCSRSLPYLITSVSMQAPDKSSCCDQ